MYNMNDIQIKSNLYMNADLIKLGSAFLVGTAATTGLVTLVRLMPLPSYMKAVLSIIVAVPSIAIALVLLYCGEQNATAELTGTITRNELLKTFGAGALTILGYNGAVALWRMFHGHAAEEYEDD